MKLIEKEIKFQRKEKIKLNKLIEQIEVNIQNNFCLLLYLNSIKLKGRILSNYKKIEELVVFLKNILNCWIV